MIRIRVDDFPQTKGEPQHTIAAFRDFNRELTALTGVRYLLGVIPGRMGVDDVLFLRNETDCVIGLHGIDHDEAMLDRHQNEFPAYLSQSQVASLLKEGRECLEAGTGRRCVVYMPPRNRIDLRTAMVLKHCGFEWFTSGPETHQVFDENRTGIGRIDSQPPHEYGRTDEMLQRESHRHLIEASEQGIDVVLTLHWTWETNIGLHHMRNFLSLIPKKHFKDFDA